MANQKQGIWQRVRDWWGRPGVRLDTKDGLVDGRRVADMTDYHEVRLDEADALAADIDVGEFTFSDLMAAVGRFAETGSALPTERRSGDEVVYVDDGLGDEMEADLARGVGDDE